MNRSNVFRNESRAVANVATALFVLATPHRQAAGSGSNAAGEPAACSRWSRR